MELDQRVDQQALEKTLRYKLINYGAEFNYLDAVSKYTALSWTAYYNDSYVTHYSNKLGVEQFPQRFKGKNRRNKKSKEAQELLAQRGDLPPNGNPSIDIDFQMMSQKDAEEEVKFMVTYDDGATIIL